MKKWIFLVCVGFFSVSISADDLPVPDLDPTHWYVNPSMSQAESQQPYRFRSLHDAVAHAPSGTSDNPTVIYLAPDVYQLNGSLEQHGLIIHQDWLRLEGLSSDARDTVLADNRGHMIGARGKGGSSPAESVMVTGTGFSAKNVTFGNYCNVDLIYSRDPSKNQEKRSATITQAYVIGARNESKVLDHFRFENVRFISKLDTIALGDVKRAYFYRSYVQGTDDFIGGGDVHVFEDSQIRSFSSKPIFAGGNKGTAFINVDWVIDFAEPSPLYLAKNASNLFIKSVRFHDEKHHLQGIYTTPYPKANKLTYSADVTLNGVKTDVQPVSNRVALSASLSSRLYANNLLAGDDGWQPAASTGDRGTVAILMPGKAVLEPGQTIAIDAMAFPASISDEETWRWRSDVPALEINSESGRLDVEAVSHQAENTATDAHLLVTSPMGVKGVMAVQLAPRLAPAPQFKRPPHIERRGDELILAYELEMTDLDRDESLVTWNRVTDVGPIPLATRHDERPLKRYSLTEADRNAMISVEVIPKLKGHKIGKASVGHFDMSAQTLALADNNVVALEPLTFPTQRQRQLLENTWMHDTFYPADQTIEWQVSRRDNPWEFGSGINGAEQKGLLTSKQGARLLYTREKSESYQKVTTILDTEKTGGQGFGSPTGQYLEVYVGYDTHSLSGYALRIERVAGASDATEVTLMAYRQGAGKKLTAPKLTPLFKPGATITLTLDGTQLRATLHNDRVQKSAKMPSEIALQATIPAAEVSGFGLQHTGTVSPGNRIVLKSVSSTFSR